MNEHVPAFIDLAARKYEIGSRWRGKKTDRTRTIIKVDMDGIYYEPVGGGKRLCWFTTWDQWVGERVN
jgi:hypothetical protein